MLYKPRQPKKLFYQLLTIRINELENKKQFKCLWINSKMKEEVSRVREATGVADAALVAQELLLYPNKSGTVADLLAEAKKHVTESADSSGVLRLLEIATYKITQIVQDDVLLECLNTNSSKTYRIEEVPRDELRLQNGEFLIPVAHFQKEIYQTFGTPFLLKLKPVRPSRFEPRLTRSSGAEGTLFSGEGADPEEGGHL